MDAIKDFIPHEQSLQMKELGFNEDCLAFYNGPFLESTEFDFSTHNSKDIGSCVKSPTYSQCFRWFRDNFNIDSHIMKNEDAFIAKGGKKYIFFIDDFGGGNSYEETQLELLKKLIQKINETNNQ
jgi:hypothetical protein